MRKDTGIGRFDGIITIVMTLVGWSSIPLFLRHFAEHIDPWTSNGWRYGFSALLWFPVILIGIQRRSLPPGIWSRALVPSIVNCGSQALFCWAHYRIDPGLLSFGLRSHIVFVTIGAALFFAAERAVIRSRGFITGILMVVGGTAGTVALGGALSGAKLQGVTLAILAGAGFAMYALSVRHYMHGLNAITSFAVISLYTAIGTVALMLALGDRGEMLPIPGGTALDLGTQQFTLLLLSAFIGIALGHVFYYHSINRLGVAVSSGVVQLQPFLVSIASMWLFSEQLTSLQWISGTIAVSGAGVILVMQHRLKSARHAPTPRPEETLAEFEDLPVDHVAAASVGETAREHQ